MKTGEMAAPAILAILTDRPAEIAAQRFDVWYEKEHIPERLVVPGFLWAARYIAIRRDSPLHLALYGLESSDILSTPAYRKLLDKTLWSAETTAIFPAIAAINRRIVLEHVAGVFATAPTISLRTGVVSEAIRGAFLEWASDGPNRAWYKSAEREDFVFNLPGDSLPTDSDLKAGREFQQTFLRHAEP